LIIDDLQRAAAQDAGLRLRVRGADLLREDDRQENQIDAGERVKASVCTHGDLLGEKRTASPSALAPPPSPC
jgi:hypothetical protein